MLTYDEILNICNKDASKVSNFGILFERLDYISIIFSRPLEQWSLKVSV